MNLLLVTITAWFLSSASAMLSRDEKLHKCFSIRAFLNNNGTTDPECMTYFLDLTLELKRTYNLTDERINFLRSLDREGRQLLIQSKREKRQSQLRLRQECRALSDLERQNLFRAIQLLKEGPSNGQLDDYDTLAALHTPMDIVRNAHGGSNFYGWHRVFLFYYENALRRRVPSVSLCYYDSTLDFLMPGATQRNTVAFSDQLFGNGQGAVINGPFANWQLSGPLSGTLRRSIGSAGSLTRPGIVDLITQDPSVFRTAHIADGQGSIGFIDPDNGRRHSLEAEHGNVHVWVGEVMNDVPTAAQDPVFYFHHCYVDYIWELFRRKQWFNFGINPANDYVVPPNPQDPHAPNTPMGGFFQIHPFWRNINGYSNEFTRVVYRYAPHPTCGNNCGGNTQFLYCPQNGNPADRCVSRATTTDSVSAQQMVAAGIGPGMAASFGGPAAAGAASSAQVAFAARTTAEREGPLGLSGFSFRSSFNDPRIQ